MSDRSKHYRRLAHGLLIGGLLVDPDRIRSERAFWSAKFTQCHVEDPVIVSAGCVVELAELA